MKRPEEIKTQKMAEKDINIDYSTQKKKTAHKKIFIIIS